MAGFGLQAFGTSPFGTGYAPTESAGSTAVTYTASGIGATPRASSGSTDVTYTASGTGYTPLPPVPVVLPPMYARAVITSGHGRAALAGDGVSVATLTADGIARAVLAAPTAHATLTTT